MDSAVNETLEQIRRNALFIQSFSKYLTNEMSNELADTLLRQRRYVRCAVPRLVIVVCGEMVIFRCHRTTIKS